MAKKSLARKAVQMTVDPAVFARDQINKAIKNPRSLAGSGLLDNAMTEGETRPDKIDKAVDEATGNNRKNNSRKKK